MTELALPMRIGELSEKSGRTVRTLHFYEEIGLLSPSARTKGGFRLYGKDALLRIHWISRLQELGFSLPEIKDFLQELHGLKDVDGAASAPRSAPSMMHDLQAFYQGKLEETRNNLARLQALEEELQSALEYLDGCSSCSPRTGVHTCRACPDESHTGREAPLLVAAVQPAPPLQD